MRTKGKPHICFVAPSAYAALSNRHDLCHIGGAERQQVLIARELVRRGYQVSFVTLDHGQPDGIVHDGIHVFKMCSLKDGIPGVRFIHPRWTSLSGAMRRARADVYYQRTGGSETGQVGIWCKCHGRPFLFACASDNDCDPELPYLRGRRERFLYRLGVRLTTVVLTQTVTQMRAFRRVFGIDPVLVRSCCEDPYEGREFQRPQPKKGRPTLLWIGRVSAEKRPDLLLDLAEICPEMRFDLVGAANQDSSYVRHVVRRARTMANVTIHGRVPYAEVDRFYRKAAALICTSDCEGFPNTFVEAWSRGIPVVTRWDGDSVVLRNGLGVVDSDVPALAQKTRELFASREQWPKCSLRAREYYVKCHGMEIIGTAYEEVFRRWSSAPAAGQR